MKLVTIVLISVAALVSCGSGGENGQVNVDSSNMITDSAALMNVDTSVIGANHIGEGQMKTDTPMTGSNVGK